MMHAELQFSAASRALLRRLMEHLSSAGLCRIPDEPHITLATCDGGYSPLAAAGLESAALSFPRFAVTVSGTGRFTTKPRGGAVYLAVAEVRRVSPVFVLQEELHRLFSAFGSVRSHHLPKRYIPHVTLASRLAVERLPALNALVLELVRFPLCLEVDRIVFLSHTGSGFYDEARRSPDEYRFGQSIRKPPACQTSGLKVERLAG